eukprot:TRINITY_DN74631_c0_g1_i1.p1 TRINITY_DN74631_c0_g1~~TRINITY_DN74631_c0_g1_i1.p1  ORF type:complete len:320 (+),score=24.01 TRINITY_DN74631_c0_g1_i1:74-961(+)
MVLQVVPRGVARVIARIPRRLLRHGKLSTCADLPTSIINLSKYPVNTLSGLEEVAKACEADFQLKQVVVLEDFFTREAVARWQSDLETRTPFVSVKKHTVWQTPKTDALPCDHVKNREVDARIGFIGRSALGEEHELVKLYKQGLLMQLAAAVSGYTLYPSTDTDGSIYATVNGKGFCTAWHLDQHPLSAVVSIRAVQGGGHFCWLPYAQGVADMTEEVAQARINAALDGVSGEVQRVRPPAGALVIFAGGEALHQVSDVTSDDHPRISAVYAWATDPHFQNSDLVKGLNWGTQQ